ncbi:hypothetical protein LH612_36370, partial [Klebsiella pneumoniae]|nr:hypothetical protein [Klebsiella pneumoniae]
PGDGQHQPVLVQGVGVEVVALGGGESGAVGAGLLADAERVRTCGAGVGIDGAAQNRRMSTYSVVRWVDLGKCTRDGVIDVVEPCREVGAALEEAINNDRDDTGYTVAPNML